jgi:hypothetical protein
VSWPTRWPEAPAERAAGAGRAPECDDPGVVSRVLTCAVAALAVVALVPPAPARAGDVLVDQPDQVGDVDVFDGGGTKPTTAQRTSIDLERFTVTRHGDGVRLSFRIARITGSRAYDQIVTAQLGKGGRLLDVLANPQGEHATAYVDGDTLCLVDVTTSRRTDTVRVDLPAGCVPRGSGVLRVTTYTQEKQGFGPGFSEDTMRVKGTVSLR